MKMVAHLYVIMQVMRKGKLYPMENISIVFIFVLKEKKKQKTKAFSSPNKTKTMPNNANQIAFVDFIGS